jgi:hypothetical protein
VVALPGTARFGRTIRRSQRLLNVSMRSQLRHTYIGAAVVAFSFASAITELIEGLKFPQLRLRSAD